MIQLGKVNRLKVARKATFGYFLDAETGESSDDILLPGNQTLNADIDVEDEVDVFIYRDSKDRYVATMHEPLAEVGELGYLKVAGIAKFGAFVEIGIERDVFVPLKEQNYNLEKGRSYLFYIYEDKTGRIAATTFVDKHLDNETVHSVGDEVTGTVYGFQTNGSAMIAVDNKYRGVILKNEYFNDIKIGDVLTLRVKKIYEEDGKLGLTPRKAPKEERETLQDEILQYLKEHNGYMPYNDKSTPEEIRRAFSESKNYFKNALGGLMKKGLVKQDENGTFLTQHE